MKNLHYRFKKHKKLFVILRDGSAFVDRWVGLNGKTYQFENHEVRIDKVRSISFYVMGLHAPRKAPSPTIVREVAHAGPRHVH